MKGVTIFLSLAAMGLAGCSTTMAPQAITPLPLVNLTVIPDQTHPQNQTQTI